MTNFIYTNAYSLLDYTSGASKSLKIMFEKLVNMGHKVYVICSTISTSKEAFDYSIAKWHESFIASKDNNKLKTIFLHNGVKYYFIKTRNWNRLFLAADEQESIYRQALEIINSCSIDILVGWGNLLLEESIFLMARNRGIKLCFYLVNPTYKNKEFFLRKYSDLVITDSYSTRDLYKDEIDCRFEVLPKFIQKPENVFTLREVNTKPYKCLFVNPTIHKGLEAFLKIAHYSERKNLNLEFKCIDINNNLRINLSILNLSSFKLPSNIKIGSAINNTNELFEGIHFLLLPSLWHESGSRLIYEAYSRGIPVIAFSSGGTKEFMKYNPDDLFPLPETYLDVHKILRIKKWDPHLMLARFQELINDKMYYDNYSKEILSIFSNLDLDKQCTDKLNKLILNLT